MPDVVVYDAGALVAAERGDRSFLVRHDRFLRHEDRLLVPAPVLAQAWRGGRQVGLDRTLRGCQVVTTTEAVARRAGALLGVSRTSDAADAIVVATALLDRAVVVVTSDPEDVERLLAASTSDARPGVLTV